jgi:hypothetical protein
MYTGRQRRMLMAFFNFNWRRLMSRLWFRHPFAAQPGVQSFLDSGVVPCRMEGEILPGEDAMYLVVELGGTQPARLMFRNERGGSHRLSETPFAPGTLVAVRIRHNTSRHEVFFRVDVSTRRRRHAYANLTPRIRSKGWFKNWQGLRYKHGDITVV